LFVNWYIYYINKLGHANKFGENAMTFVVKSTHDNTIALPAWLMNQLQLHDGEEVKTSIEGQTLRLTPLEQFLALRGALQEDEAFDQAMAYLDQAWQTWTLPPSA